MREYYTTICHIECKINQKKCKLVAIIMATLTTAVIFIIFLSRALKITPDTQYFYNLRGYFVRCRVKIWA